MLVPCEMGSHVGVQEIGSTDLSVVSPLASPSAEPNVFIVPIVIVLNICCTLLYVIVLVLLDPFLSCLIPSCLACLYQFCLND